MAQHPYTDSYPARALYGPRTSFPDPQVVGDMALAVASDQSNTLYQVRSGNWVPVSVIGAGGPGSDTTAVHVNQTSIGYVLITGSIEGLGAIEGQLISSDWGLSPTQQDPPHNLTAVEDSAVPLGGANLRPGVETWQLVSQDFLNKLTLPTSPVSVTLPDPVVHGVTLTWDDVASWASSYSSLLLVFRGGAFLTTIAATLSTWADDGSLATSGAYTLPTTNETGGMIAYGPIRSHNRPVAELGATASGTITPDTLITIYDSAGTAYHIPAKLVP